LDWSLAFTKGPNGAGVSLPSPEDGNRSSFRNFSFSNCFEFRTMDEVQNLNDSKGKLFSSSRKNGREQSAPEIIQILLESLILKKPVAWRAEGISAVIHKSI
jgi:hypothetical protein